MTEKKYTPKCSLCGIAPSGRNCNNPEGENPPFCPGINHRERIESATRNTCEGNMREFALNSSIQESEGYMDKDMGYGKVKPVKPRIEEIIDFSKKMNYSKLGLAFCMGLRNEAKIVERLFSAHGFEVVSVICKVGGVPKEDLGIKSHQKIREGDSFEPMCNPVAQAYILNDFSCEFNILLGLCVGHDSLFFKHAEAPCTVLAVKDRMTGHNPLAAVYNLDSYFRSLKK